MYSPGAHPGSSAYRLLIQNRDFQKNLLVGRKEKGDINIYFLDSSYILGEGFFECTVDGSHPNDLDSSRIANALISTIEDILN
jgi:hypothetical protein